MADMNAPPPLLSAHIEKRPFGLLLGSTPQRAPVHSSSCGALLRLCEAICDFCRYHVQDRVRLAFAGAISRDIKLSAAAFRPGRHFRVSRHRDPAPVGVRHTVPVESYLLHCSGIMSCRKKVPSASDQLL